MHNSGHRVVFDVVYNHTRRRRPLGPTLKFRGIDNAPITGSRGRPRFDLNFRLRQRAQLSHPRVLQLCHDSLRYWAEACGVDGFRFDLASTLARGTEWAFKRQARFCGATRRPVLSRVKLIAEALGFGPKTVTSRQFPARMVGWNGPFATTLAPLLGRRGRSFAGLADACRFRPAVRQAPAARRATSINFVTAHDGFTLADLVSLRTTSTTRRTAEDNHDGSDDNRSSNFGHEGPSDDGDIVAVRPAHAAKLFRVRAAGTGRAAPSGRG